MIVAEHPTAGPPALGREHAFDAVPGQDLLDLRLAEAAHLAPAPGHKLAWIERQSSLPGMFGHHKSNAKRSFAAEAVQRGELLELVVERMPRFTRQPSGHPLRGHILQIRQRLQQVRRKIADHRDH